MQSNNELKNPDYGYWSRQTVLDGLKSIRAVLAIGVAATLFAAVHPVVGTLYAAYVIIDTVIKNSQER